MLPEDVYVVYDCSDDSIYSVHSLKSMADLSRTDAVQRIRHMRRGSEDVDLLDKLKMRFCVTTLPEALRWMAETTEQPYDDK